MLLFVQSLIDLIWEASVVIRDDQGHEGAVFDILFITGHMDGILARFCWPVTNVTWPIILVLALDFGLWRSLDGKTWRHSRLDSVSEGVKNCRLDTFSGNLSGSKLQPVLKWQHPSFICSVWFLTPSLVFKAQSPFGRRFMDVVKEIMIGEKIWCLLLVQQQLDKYRWTWTRCDYSPNTPTSVPMDSTTKVAGLPTMPPSKPGPQALICWGPASWPTVTSNGLERGKNKKKSDHTVCCCFGNVTTYA